MMAARAGLLSCEVCGLLNRRGDPRLGRPLCARCGTALYTRKPDSIIRTWALLIAAYVLYIPANVMPVLETRGIAEETTDTILGGAVRLWAQGAWPLSLVIIIASFGVPLVKLVVLTWFLVTVQGGGGANTLQRAKLYRAVDFIGRWSMVDIYIGGLLISLVRFHPFATVSVGPAAVAFAAVVVLTIMASRSFDPRLMWDEVPRPLTPYAARHG